MSRIIRNLDVGQDTQTVALPLGAQFLPTAHRGPDDRIVLYVLVDMDLKMTWRHIVLVGPDVHIDSMLEKGGRYVTTIPADGTHGSLHLFDLGS